MQSSSWALAITVGSGESILAHFQGDDDVTGLFESSNDRTGNALVGEKSQTHGAATSKVASSRA